MSKEDYYSILNISRNASDDEIKKAYRRLAMKYHPDRNSGNKDSEHKFKTINEAYEVLSDKSKRQAYDMYGHAGVDASSFHTARGGGGAGFADIFEDIFGDIFGGRATGGGGASSRSYAQQGADLRYSLDLSLEEAVRGTEVKIRIRTRVACSSCKGTGAKGGAKPVACNTCGGSGQVRLQQGFFSIQQTCPACHGRGSVIKEYCKQCGGSGLINDQKTLSVKVPAGVDSGDRIRLAGEGEAGPNKGLCGDLYVHINVKEHNIFKRDGIHLYCDVPISIATAALGGEVEVPTLEGRLKLKIPAETQTGKLFRLRNKGVRSVRGDGPGDLLCRVVVETPVNLNKEQKELLQQLEDSMCKDSQRCTPKASSWFKSVKNFFDEMKF